jgi:hypothetical protein
MPYDCKVCGERVYGLGLHPCNNRPVTATVNGITPVTSHAVTGCNACNTKDLLIEDLRRQVERLLNHSADAPKEGPPETVKKKSRAEYMKKRRAAAKGNV